MKCPKCNEECECDEVDVGVGIIYGPPRCPNCDWSASDTLIKEMTTPEKLEFIKDTDIELKDIES